MKSFEQRVQINACRVMTIQQSQNEVRLESHDWTLAALGEQAVVRPGVRLALGETNEILWITRSVIQMDLREQRLSPVARYIGRAFAQLLENANSTLFSTHSSSN